MKKTILAVGVSLVSFMLPLGASAATFSKIYVFGDSTSDTGNVFNVTTFANSLDSTIPIDPPSPPYFNGRYSNGPVWVDYLTEDLGLNLTPSTALAVPYPIIINPNGELGVNFFFNGATTTQSVNFAFGGARTGLDNAGDPRLPGVLREIQGFRNDLLLANQSADPEALYIVWAAGSNDYSTGAFREPTIPIANLATGISSLYEAGARDILVANAPDLGKTARARTLDPNEANALTQLTQAHNASLDITLNNLSQTLEGVNLIPFDVNSIFQDAIANPQKFGLTNVTEACLSLGPNSLISCSNPDEYLFWDGIHPTTKAHQVVGELAFQRLKSDPKPVPEPSFPVPLGVLGFAWLVHSISRSSFSRTPMR